MALCNGSNKHNTLTNFILFNFFKFSLEKKGKQIRIAKNKRKRQTDLHLKQILMNSDQDFFNFLCHFYTDPVQLNHPPNSTSAIPQASYFPSHNL